MGAMHLPSLLAHPGVPNTRLLKNVLKFSRTVWTVFLFYANTVRLPRLVQGTGTFAMGQFKLNVITTSYSTLYVNHNVHLSISKGILNL